METPCAGPGQDGEILAGHLAQATDFLCNPVAERTIMDRTVSGLPAQEYYQAAGEIMDLGLAKGIKIDVVDTADCPMRMKKRIIREGIEI